MKNIFVETGLLKRLPAILARSYPAKRAVLVSDAGLLRGPAGALARALKRAGWRLDVYALPQGEAAKSLAAVAALHTFLLKKRVERRTPLIAVGGGAVGDSAGFAAATYYRGIPLVHVPTTLLAQVDSAIGGKTAVNHPLAKNAIGAFHQPVLVASDVSVLKTLPEREFLSGLGEVVKYALVFDRAFLRRLDADWAKLLRRDPAALTRTVRDCAAWKVRVVAADERDLTGRRELLNFGHTLGHALETEAGYGNFRHGEAVTWGMRFAVELSVGRGWMKKTLAEADELLSFLPAPAWPKGLTRSRLWKALASDKKVKDGKSVFILLREVGKPVRVNDITRAELDAALDRLLPGRK